MYAAVLHGGASQKEERKMQGRRSGAPILEGMVRSHATTGHDCLDRCLVSPSPQLQQQIQAELQNLRSNANLEVVSRALRFRLETPVGMNDGVIFPGNYFPVGTPPNVVRSAAADRAPLRGTVRVIVVLVDFSDLNMAATQQHFQDLFFSTGVLPDGSVREYFTEVSHGLIDLTGEVVGPYRLPRTLAQYANGASGTGNVLPNARTMARDAAEAANPDVDFSLYDNDGNGFVDAFIVIHAGRGAEETGGAGDIWSHKWVLSGGELNADGTRIFAYLTVPEDSRIGVCAHELGHLVFGWPDLYDTDSSSEGLGNWCLMAGGSWNGGGNVPCHPSAWCKAGQGWVSVINQNSNATVNIADVKTSHTVHRLWKDGAPGNEYFLLENRQQALYDRNLPGGGLLIFHIDESIEGNSNESHYKVALEQADGLRGLETSTNRGDAGDPFPGSSNNVTFNATSNPNSKSYGNAATCVSVTNIGPSGPVMTVRLAVVCGKVKEGKESVKDTAKELVKENREKARKERFKERIDKSRLKEFRPDKPRFEKRPEKPEIDKAVRFDKDPISEKGGEKFADKNTEGGFGGGFGTQAGPPEMEDLQERVAALEACIEGLEPFITSALRPDLSQGALANEPDLDEAQLRMQEGAAEAKRLYDTKQRDY